MLNENDASNRIDGQQNNIKWDTKRKQYVYSSHDLFIEDGMPNLILLDLKTNLLNKY